MTRLSHTHGSVINKYRMENGILSPLKQHTAGQTHWGLKEKSGVSGLEFSYFLPHVIILNSANYNNIDGGSQEHVQGGTTQTPSKKERRCCRAVSRSGGHVVVIW